MRWWRCAPPAYACAPTPRVRRARLASAVATRALSGMSMKRSSSEATPMAAASLHAVSRCVARKTYRILRARALQWFQLQILAYSRRSAAFHIGGVDILQRDEPAGASASSLTFSGASLSASLTERRCPHRGENFAGRLDRFTTPRCRPCSIFAGGRHPRE